MAAYINDFTTKEAPAETVANEENTTVCKLCLTKTSRYKCPRCGIFYCSLSCYRGEKHAGCSEQFYKNNFMEVMKNKKGSEEDRKKMLEILKRVDAEYKPMFDEEGAELDEEEEGENTETLAERMAGLDLDKDTDLIWERLTENEKREFESVLQAGKLGSLVPLWKAWWQQHDQSLVKEIGIDPSPPSSPPSTPPQEKPKESSYIDEVKVDLDKMASDLGLNYKDEEITEEEISKELSTSCNCPTVLKKIPNLSDLLQNKKPSECVMYNLLNVLYSYACVARLYNGAHNDVPVQVSQNLLEVSATLSDNANYNETEGSLASAMHNASKSLSTSNTFSTSILQDVTHILLGAASDAPITYIQSALSDLHRLLGAARKQLVKNFKKSLINGDAKDSKPSKDKAQLQKTCFNCQKKLEFLLAWLAENQDKPRLLLLEVDAMYRSRRLLDEQYNETRSALEKQWGGIKPPTKPTAKYTLIEELG